jgi:hypothetical protein
MDEIPTTSTLWMKTIQVDEILKKLKTKRITLKFEKKRCGMFKLLVDKFGESEKIKIKIKM